MSYTTLVSALRARVFELLIARLAGSLLTDFANHYIEQLERDLVISSTNSVKPSTVRKYRSITRKLEAFEKQSRTRVRLKDFNESFRSKFAHFLRTSERLSENTTGRYLKMVKTFALKAKAQGIEEIKDDEGNSHDPKQYVQSHFVPQDDTRDARLLADEWTRIRKERTRLLAETDHHALSDQTLSADMKTYRTKLRDLPSDQSSKTKYSDITWPTKP